MPQPHCFACCKSFCRTLLLLVLSMLSMLPILLMLLMNDTVVYILQLTREKFDLLPAINRFIDLEIAAYKFINLVRLPYLTIHELN